MSYSRLAEKLRNVALLKSCASLLNWDEQTYLPRQGAEHRANQLGLLAGMAHEQATSPEIGELLESLSANPAELGPADSPQAANVREAKRTYDRATRLPRALVEELSRTATLAQHAWIDARKQKDFGAFLPWLEKTVQLKRDEADALGSDTGIRYDALLEDYEPGATAAEITRVFSELRPPLVDLVQRIKDSGIDPETSLLTRHYPVDVQRRMGREAAELIGFDFTAGRLDETAHPFCTGIGPGDCRLTTRYDEHHFPGAFFGTLHEAGHGIYEQGLSRDDFGLPTGDACSLGIHESQSRMWENFVGRSSAFWRFFYPRLQKAFPGTLEGIGGERFHAAINDVRPTWIRVESDEVTYNLHIMLRFELEQALIGGSLAPADVPGAWNSAFQASFGMTPTDDSLGCLQDVHWSAGLLGYFPTYSLGNMYAAQFFEAADAALGGLDEMFVRGEFQPLKEWLRTNIHQHGRRYRAPQLVENVTGKPLSAEPLLRYLDRKLTPLYSL